MAGSYDTDLVLLSIAVAMMASYTALDLAGRVTHSGGATARWWLFGGAFAMGTGIWSMHFIGMLAFSLPIRLAYDIGTTFASLVIAIAISGFALFAVSQKTLTKSRLLASGVVMGGGICAMHYTGMVAMKMMPPIQYDPLLFLASVLIAVGASIVALYLAFTLRARASGRGILYRILSAMVMGLAITGMHYTGMAAAHFEPGSLCLVGHSFDLANEQLAYVIGVAVLSLLAVTLIGSMFDARMSGHRARTLHEMERANREQRFISEIVTQTTQPFVVGDAQARLVRCNPAFELLTGYSRDELRDMTLMQLSSGRWPNLDDQEISKAILTGKPARYENEYRRKDGSPVPVLIVGDVFRNDRGEVERIYAFVTDLTERKSIEDAMVGEREFLRAIMDSLNEGIAACDAQGILTFFNAAAKEILGLPLAPLPSEKWTEHYSVYLADGKARTTTAQLPLVRALHGETVKNVELVIAPKHMARRSILVNGRQIATPSGEVLGAVVAFHDITERKRTEADLETRNNELRFINDVVEQTDQAFCAVDLQGRLIRFNRALESLNGYSADELQNMPVQQLSSGRWPDRDMQKITEALQTGQPVRYENEYRHKDGTVKMAEVVGGAYHNKNGDIECAYAFVTDLTERKRGEEALRESEERFRLSFEFAAIGIAAVSLSGRWLRVNPTLCQMLGYSEVEMLATDFQSITHPDDLAGDLEAITKLIAGEINHYRAEKRYIHKDGHAVWIRLNVALARNAAGSPQHFACQIEDITVRKSAVDALNMRTRELETTNLELKRSNRELEQFAFASSHDLQTPIRSVVSFAQMLEHDFKDKLGAQGGEYIQQIVTSSHRMQRLVQSLLEYSLISSKPDRHWVNLNNVMEEVREHLRPEIEERSVVLECPQLPTVNADAKQMTQLLRSLVSNAIKFQSRNPPIVRIGARQQGNDWAISVSDEGIGIEARHHGRIFQMFQRLNALDQYEGDGIGLSMCEKIVHNHGGKLWVESVPGKGSTFYFSIPQRGGND